MVRGATINDLPDLGRSCAPSSHLERAITDALDRKRSTARRSEGERSNPTGEHGATGREAYGPQPLRLRQDARPPRSADNRRRQDGEAVSGRDRDQAPSAGEFRVNRNDARISRRDAWAGVGDALGRSIPSDCDGEPPRSSQGNRETAAVGDIHHRRSRGDHGPHSERTPRSSTASQNAAGALTDGCLIFRVAGWRKRLHLPDSIWVPVGAIAVVLLLNAVVWLIYS